MTSIDCDGLIERGEMEGFTYDKTADAFPELSATKPIDCNNDSGNSDPGELLVHTENYSANDKVKENSEVLSMPWHIRAWRRLRGRTYPPREPRIITR